LLLRASPPPPPPVPTLPTPSTPFHQNNYSSRWTAVIAGVFLIAAIFSGWTRQVGKTTHKLRESVDLDLGFLFMVVRMADPFRREPRGFREWVVFTRCAMCQ
jgi:hypothetical protein